MRLSEQSTAQITRWIAEPSGWMLGDLENGASQRVEREAGGQQQAGLAV